MRERGVELGQEEESDQEEAIDLGAVSQHSRQRALRELRGAHQRAVKIPDRKRIESVYKSILHQDSKRHQPQIRRVNPVTTAREASQRIVMRLEEFKEGFESESSECEDGDLPRTRYNDRDDLFLDSSDEDDY
eukprot:TRINITY_DN7113_c0_g1_i2.p1 TRINITY_DN7113_c0_g1~~TRINITY_DN7113_c0_g1_i2.p1  ORF type:complete len:133 (+),score=31.06 TRINITY_DN7113_c0_g1_i2:221-619(+)